MSPFLQLGTGTTPWDLPPSTGLPSNWRVSFYWDAQALRRLVTLPQQETLSEVLEAVSCIPGIESQLQKIETVLHELFSNALDHGVLGLSSALKSSADGFVEFYCQRGIRLESLTEAFIRVDMEYLPEGAFTGSGGCLLVRIQDSGKGFDHQGLMAGLCAGRESPGTLLPYGRGLRLVKSLCDSVRFLENGSCVEALISWQTSH